MIWCPQLEEAQHYSRDVEALHALSCLLDCAMLCGPPVDLPILQEEIPERGRFAQPRRHKGPHEQVESCLQLRRVGLVQRAKRKLLQRRRIRPCLVAARRTSLPLPGTSISPPSTVQRERNTADVLVLLEHLCHEHAMCRNAYHTPGVRLIP